MKALKYTLLALSVVLITSCKKENTTDKVEEKTEATTTVDGLEKATPVKEEGAVDPAVAPVMSFESDTYDFGDVKASTKTEKVVEFTNTGKSPLVIKNAKASCGCTVPDYSKEPVAPGETGTIKVSYKAPATNGKQTKTVTLTTNTVGKTERFKITANVVGGKAKQAPKPQKAPAQKLPAPKLESVN